MGVGLRQQIDEQGGQERSLLVPSGTIRPRPPRALHIGFDEDVLQQFPDHYFDWVYLDTSHEYESTKVELSLLSRKVKPEGIILGDDWFSDPSHLFYGQYRAVTEFVRDFGYSIVYASDTDHQWAIRKA